MLDHLETAVLGDLELPLLDGRIVELLYLAALQADQVVVVTTLVEFEDGMPGIEVMPPQQAGLLELRQYPIDSGETDVHVILGQVTVHILRAQVAAWRVDRLLEQVEDLDARDGGLEPDIPEVLRIGHGYKEVSIPDWMTPYDIVFVPANGNCSRFRRLTSRPSLSSLLP